MIKSTILRSIGVLSVLALASSAHAQPITKWTLAVYNKGSAVPLSKAERRAADVVCNVESASPIVTSPQSMAAVWEDALHPDKLCVWVDSGGGPLASMPLGGSYEASISSTNSLGVTLESKRVPFQHVRFR
jgi:hypothetical protein